MSSHHPNLFIIGAPKCGTTALAHYLEQHPEIFVAPKEIHYFAPELFDSHQLAEKPIKTYLDLFDPGRTCKIRCDASGLYLYSRQAVPTIVQTYPDAKMIVMVRNPIEMAPSFHNELRRNLAEDVDDFQKAWHLQAIRRHGEQLPAQHLVNQHKLHLWQYGEICKLGEQYQRLIDHVSPDNLCTILFDDFVKDTKQVYADVLAFLGLPDDERSEFPRVNSRADLRSTSVEKLLRRFVRSDVGRPIVATYLSLKRGLELGDISLLRKLRQANRRTVPPQHLPSDFQDKLRQYFHEDIELLSELLERDLSHWYNT